MASRIEQLVGRINALLDSSRFAEAEPLLRRALATEPTDGNLLMLMVQTCVHLGSTDRTLYYARALAAAHPDHAGAIHTAAKAMRMLRSVQPAIDLCREFLARSPDGPEHHYVRNTLMLALHDQRDFEGMLQVADGAPGGPDAHPRLNYSRAVALLQVTRADEGYALLSDHCRALEQAQAGSPGDSAAIRTLSDLCYATTLSAALSAAEIMNVHQWYGQRAREAQATLKPLPPLAPLPPPPRHLPAASPASPARPLRIGFISADFREHSVAYFIEPLLEHLPRDRFALRFFHTGARDEGTMRLFTASGGDPAAWFAMAGIDSYTLAATIAAQQLDVLIDLSGHSGGTSLDALLHNVAPRTATYCGYPHTTGHPGVHYRIVDALTDPPGSEWQATEQLIRLAPCFLCYKPPASLLAAQPRTQRDPSAPFTFGSFNSIIKFNPACAELWCQVLAAVPGSHLLLKATGLRSPITRARITGAFTDRGIDSARIEFADFIADRTAASALYNRIDLALDTYPYHGTTTTCEALCMGVPVISRIGDRHASRVGLSLLSAVGLSALAATDDATFVRTASTLAHNPAQLSTLRAGLRDRVLASPLCDGPAFARAFASAIESMTAAAHG